MALSLLLISCGDGQTGTDIGNPDSGGFGIRLADGPGPAPIFVDDGGTVRDGDEVRGIDIALELRGND